MQAAPLIQRVRRLLLDNASISPADAGEFWSDAIITLFLNESQLLFTSALLEGRGVRAADIHLSGMLETIVPGPTDVLPDDFMESSSAQVFDPVNIADAAMARIFTGGNGFNYRNVGLHSCIIFQDSYEFYFNGLACEGILHYYKYPAVITDNNLDPDFDIQTFSSDIYEDIIIPQAAVLLGLKEPQTQREVKRMQKVMKLIGIKLHPTIFYPTEKEIAVQSQRVGR